MPSCMNAGEYTQFYLHLSHLKNTNYLPEGNNYLSTHYHPNRNHPSAHAADGSHTHAQISLWHDVNLLIHLANYCPNRSRHFAFSFWLLNLLPFLHLSPHIITQYNRTRLAVSQGWIYMVATSLKPCS